MIGNESLGEVREKYQYVGGIEMVRFGFSIKTRSGQRVDNIMIMAESQADAERRLRQMYQRCEILHCSTRAVPRRVDTLDVEEVIGLISGSDPAVLRVRQ